jgi:hypothetical protein
VLSGAPVQTIMTHTVHLAPATAAGTAGPPAVNLHYPASSVPRGGEPIAQQGADLPSRRWPGPCERSKTTGRSMLGHYRRPTLRDLTHASGVGKSTSASWEDAECYTSSDRADVLRLQSFLSLSRFEFDLLVLIQRPVAGANLKARRRYGDVEGPAGSLKAGRLGAAGIRHGLREGFAGTSRRGRSSVTGCGALVERDVPGGGAGLGLAPLSKRWWERGGR